MPAKLILEIDSDNYPIPFEYELGDASLMTDLMRGIMPSIRYIVEAPIVGPLTFTFTVENGEVQTTTPAQPTLDEAEDDGELEPSPDGGESPEEDEDDTDDDDYEYDEED